MVRIIAGRINSVETLFKLKAGIIHFLYTKILKKYFFLFDPEDVHDGMTKMGVILGDNPITKWKTSLLFSYQNPVLEQEILGIKFKNPIGLAAGFDKDARLTQILPSIGFGFAEVGSITGQRCEGNPKPRLWRLPDQKSLVVYYGLKNEGCEAISSRLSKLKFEFPIGISVAKTNCAATAERAAGIADYVKAYKTMLPVGDYTTINISCPNAFGGLPFTTPESLDELLTAIDNVEAGPATPSSRQTSLLSLRALDGTPSVRATRTSGKPIFLKLPPDLTMNELDGLLEVASKHMICGYICSNLTKNRNNPKLAGAKIPEKGGLSGKVVEDLANAQIAHVYRRTGGKSVIVGLGGVFSAADAYKKIRLGANLIQLITGMIFEGPQLIGQINQGLVELLKKDGFTSISQAVGKGVS